ncbi:hypothetical protein AGR7A_pAt30133 [Agrobacterium deltaense NCPPB 1641]|uniref:Uncharacterized protein n=1 Tax=Agrobacterium deltaense NCPPB 1641 TaxID=1183425 RepID=A0A1S7UB96_9HYPH|nr:hypothetical protein AGR7A_pAt30133 [Agrobacterium deltaense NCPPB 1641]
MQKAAHESVVRMRDKVIARFKTRNGWHDEQVILMQIPTDLAFIHVHRRRKNEPLLVEQMLDPVDSQGRVSTRNEHRGACEVEYGE